MEPTMRQPEGLSSPWQLPAAAGSTGALVVQNGRQSGARRALSVPLTLIGQASGCDIRLHVEGVDAIHCAILAEPSGPLLRDLDSGSGTRVNGMPVHLHRLVSGDVIEIGPVRFAVELNEPPTAEAPSADLVLIEREREALRIQAAAVAAQQAALTEEEARLEQRATALARQEEQLASHLEERQNRLDEEQERLRQERVAFESHCDASRAGIAREREVVQQLRAQADQERDKAIRERHRLGELRRRLRKRWKRHWDGQLASLQKREAALQAGQDRLQRERARVRAFQERVNGELELGRRQLRAEWQELGLAQQRLEEWRNQEMGEYRRRRHELAQAAEALAQERQHWQRYHTGLVREAQGLEARIGQQRKRLDVLQREVAELEARLLPGQVESPPALSLALLPPEHGAVLPVEPWPARLRDLAGELGDQRARLAEQWHRLLQLHQQWQEERVTALAELESTAQTLELRQRELQRGEQELAGTRAELARRREELALQRQKLEGWQARLALEEADWKAARDALLAQIESREQLAVVRANQLEQVHQRRNQRRRQEVAELHAARARCEEARRQYSGLWHECERLRGELSQQLRAQAGHALALERSRQELLLRSPDSVRAEARVEKLRRREAGRLDEEARQLEGQRQQLLAERERLDEKAARLREQEEELAQRHQALAKELAKWESQQVGAGEEEAQRAQELARLRAQHAIDERQLRQLHEELERLARLLIEEADSGPQPAQHAA